MIPAAEMLIGCCCLIKRSEGPRNAKVRYRITGRAQQLVQSILYHLSRNDNRLFIRRTLQAGLILGTVSIITLPLSSIILQRINPCTYGLADYPSDSLYPSSLAMTSSRSRLPAEWSFWLQQLLFTEEELRPPTWFFFYHVYNNMPTAV